MTTLIVIVGGLQWDTMRRQLGQIVSGSEQTDRLIKETHNLAEHAGKQADNAALLAQAARDQVNRLQSLTEAANKQNAAMGAQLNAMHKQLELTDRPWIKVALTPGGPLKFQNDNKEVAIFSRVLIKNIGHSVATQVRLKYEVFLSPWGDAIFREPVARQKKLCDDFAAEKTDASKDGVSLFPGDESDGVTSSTITLAYSNIIHFPDSAGQFFIIPIVIGCVDYQFASSSNHHQTRFIYEVAQPEPITGHFQRMEVGKDIPTEKLYFDRYFFGGTFAF